MAFFVPDSYENFYEEIVQRFKLLLQQHVLVGIDAADLNQWLSNFQSPEEKYLSAHLLDRLIYRSGNMLCSSFQHLIHSELPTFLHQNGYQIPNGLVSFHEDLQTAGSECPIRFVAIDGGFESVPGKSGAVIIREFKRHLNIDKRILCRPENMAALPSHVKHLVFIDDLLGTGSQFSKFSKFYDLNSLRVRFAMAYSPQLAHVFGINHLKREYPWLTLLPIEEVGAEHQFFHETGSENLWRGDGSNRADDVKIFCDSVAEKSGIPKRTKHSLDLSVLFAHAAPNNTLSLYWARSGYWHPLIPR